MNQIKLTLLSFFVTISTISYCQHDEDIELLEELTSSISVGVNTQDYGMILNAFIHPTALIYSTYNGMSGGDYSPESNTAQGLSDFIKNSKESITQHFDFTNVKIISEGRAVVTTRYKVKIANKKSHQGDEYYTAIKTKNGWKFISLMFTLESWSE